LPSASKPKPIAPRLRVRRDDAAVRAACDCARRFRDIARRAGGDDAARSATVDAELARAEGRDDRAGREHAAAEWNARGARYRAAYARWRLAEALLARTWSRRHDAASCSLTLGVASR
jgi:hypothetical protein